MSKMMYYAVCEVASDCSDDFALCINGTCRCSESYIYSNGYCIKCPVFNQCGGELCCTDQTPIYITAAQIALSAALIMGMAALTMVVYRLCTKPRYLSARQRALAARNGLNVDSESLSYANYLRASLTSMQIRVLTRLRDRPPTYDSRQTRITMPEAPPPYEGVTEGMPLPPAYTETVVSPTGYINSTFVDPDAGSVSRCADSDSISSRNCSNNNVNHNCGINRSVDDTGDKDKDTEDSVDEKTETANETRIPI